MIHISHLEYAEPTPVCDVKAGVFQYVTPQGEQVEAEFYVRTCEDSDHAKRIDDYNEQFTDMYSKLIIDGNTHIEYIENKPNPFF